MTVDGSMIRARPSSSRAKSCHMVAYWWASSPTMPTQCGGRSAAASGSWPAPTALTCSSRSMPLPRSLLRNEGSRSSFSTAAAGSGGVTARGLRRMAWAALSPPVPASAPVVALRVSAAAAFSGTGDSPRSRRLRTSRTVAGDMPAERATSRSDAFGCWARNSAARRRPAPLSSGRTLPSRPTRALDCGACSPEVFLMAATVLAARPTEWPIARSDMWGWDTMIRSAAARRSAWDSGRPWATFSWTARRKTSASLPSKNVTSMVSCPRKDAAIRRCIPSITRMVRRSTRIGGSDVSSSASRAMWALSSPLSRGESAGRSDSTETASTTGPPSLAGAAGSWVPGGGGVALLAGPTDADA